MREVIVVGSAAAAAKDDCCGAANTATPKAKGRTMMKMMIVASGVKGRMSWLLVQQGKKGRKGREGRAATGACCGCWFSGNVSKGSNTFL
jgi:hypothetical protein